MVDEPTAWDNPRPMVVCFLYVVFHRLLQLLALRRKDGAEKDIGLEEPLSIGQEFRGQPELSPTRSTPDGWSCRSGNRQIIQGSTP